MNIILTADITGEAAEKIVRELSALLSANGCDVVETPLGGIHIISATVSAPIPAAEVPPELPDVPPDAAPLVPMDLQQCDVCDCVIGQCECAHCDKCKPEIEELDVAFESEVHPEPIGSCLILTLSTSQQTPVHQASGVQNTVLKVKQVESDADVVRFFFNKFFHALPRQTDESREHFVNKPHACGPTTVRLLIDIGNKTYPSLVDLEVGDADVLVLGDDLLQLMESADVPRE